MYKRWRSCSKCYGMVCFGTYLTHVQTCDNVHVQSARGWTDSVHTWYMSKPVISFVFKVLRNRLLWYILENMSKPVISFVFDVLRNGLLRYILDTCPNLWYRSCSKCYGMGCFGTNLTHVQTCDDVRVQSATEWFASVHTWHMSKPAITFMFKVLGDGLIRCILDTCPKPVITFMFKVLGDGLIRCILDTCPNLR